MAKVVELSLFPVEFGEAPETPAPEREEWWELPKCLNPIADPCPSCELREFCTDECARVNYPLFVNREPKRFSQWLKFPVSITVIPIVPEGVRE